MARRYWALLALSIAACAGDPDEQIGGGQTDVVIATDIMSEVGGVSDVSTDTGGPECTGDGDCSFSDLGACERAFCMAGTCQRGPVAAEAACDDGDPCTTGDRCVDDGGTLTCEPAAATCDDGNVCNGLETCDASGCVPGDPLQCADENQCNGAETCDPALGCQAGPPLGCPDDGNQCNGIETCEPASGCTSVGGLVCDDGSDCTVDSCDSVLGCQHVLDPGAAGCCASDEDCDDGNDCTSATCVEGSCVATDVEGSCATGDLCSPLGLCDSGECSSEPVDGCDTLCVLSGSAGDIVDCPVGLARVGEAGDPATTLLLSLGYQSAAADLVAFVEPVCFDDVCVATAIPQSATALQGSGHTAFIAPSDPLDWNGTAQMELSHLTAPNTAISGAWYDGDNLVGDPALVTVRFRLNVDVDASPVVLHSLSAGGAGEAALAARLLDTVIVTDTPCGGAVCFDGQPCTADTCDGGSCTNAVGEGACDDGNPCTVGGECDPEGNCIPGAFADSGSSCGVGCALGSCDGMGSCTLEAGDCSGGDCVVASCDVGTGNCVSAPDLGVTCDDGDACTDADSCSDEGVCAGLPAFCDDGLGCTMDACEPGTGCVFTPMPAICDDGNPCTADTCGETGCSYQSIPGGCDDGDQCTESDSCLDGLCIGSPSPSCGCTSDAQCAALDDGNLCNGTLMCIAGQCKVAPGSVVTCPADGFGCQESWTCNPADGECTGTAVSCDDGNDCTVDICTPTDGCSNVAGNDCVFDWICELSGAANAEVECLLQMARGGQTEPVPTGADFKLSYDTETLELLNFVDEFCVGAVCFPFDLATCAGDGTGCTYEKLAPTGHDLVVVPSDAADWAGKVALLFFHSGNPEQGLTDAFLQGEGVAGEPLFLKARFRLLTEVSAEEPTRVDIISPNFNPATGAPMSVTVQQTGTGRVFVPKAQ